MSHNIVYNGNNNFLFIFACALSVRLSQGKRFLFSLIFKMHREDIYFRCQAENKSITSRVYTFHCTQLHHHHTLGVRLHRAIQFRVYAINYAKVFAMKLQPN